jgi:apolipoprotein D and lipocalin family protein
MKKLSALCFALAGIAASMSGQERPVQVVTSVDLARYAGTWYEIARYPNSFQEFCAGDVTATYTLLEDGRIRVVNSCRDEKGEIKEVDGIARKQEDDGPDTKLEVRFAPAFLSFLPFVWGDYWIIDLAEDYSYVVIGGPTREYLWILAREPEIPSATYDGIMKRLKDQGFAPSRLVKTRQQENKSR